MTDVARAKRTARALKRTADLDTKIVAEFDALGDTVLNDAVKPPHCKKCGVEVIAIAGSQMTPGRMPNWRHNWGAYPTLQARPSCPWSAGPLFDDQVEGGGDDDPIKDGNVDGRWTEGD